MKSAEDTLILSAVYTVRSLGFDWQVHQGSRVVTVTQQKHISAVGPSCSKHPANTSISDPWLTLMKHYKQTFLNRLESLVELAAFFNTITLKRHLIPSFLSHTFGDGLQSGAALQQKYCWWFPCHCQQLIQYCKVTQSYRSLLGEVHTEAAAVKLLHAE